MKQTCKWMAVGTTGLLLLVAGCGGNDTAKAPTSEELKSFQQADMSKAPPDIQARIDAARKRGPQGPPTTPK